LAFSAAVAGPAKAVAGRSSIVIAIARLCRFRIVSVII
jgi:hypothetical protein